MSVNYAKKTWQNNEILLADDLNHIEEGIVRAIFQANQNEKRIATFEIPPYLINNLSDLEKELYAKYQMSRTGKVFATKHQKYAVNTSSFGTKIHDSEGLVCEASTATQEGRDDFEEYLPFQWEHCNYVRDDDGTARPTALEGRPNYKTTGAVDVGCVSATFWWKFEEDDTSYTIYMSDMPHPEMALVPWIEAVKTDGTVLPFYAGSAYFSGIASDGLLRSQPNLSPAYNQSHNTCITDYQKKGKGYWGAGMEFITHGIIFSELKFGTANVQKWSQGYTSYSFQNTCALAEKGVKRVLSKSAWACDVGNCVSVSSGGLTKAPDRSETTCHTKADRVRVKSMEEITISGTKYYALNLDVGTAFDTTTDTYVTSMPCWNGETDKVFGHHDGAVVNNARHTTRIHGREYNNGQWFVAANCGLYAIDHKWHIYYAPKGTAHNTGLSGYTDGGYIILTSDGWVGDYKINHNCAIAYPFEGGGGSAVGLGDYYYAGSIASAPDGTTREVLIGGALWNGSASGLLSLYCGNGLGYAGWVSASRD